jgi:diacylglycerol kinase family enzyme
VVLNGNARAVTDRVVRKIRTVLGEDALYISQSVEQSRFVARHIVNKGYEVVLCGGGDGTFGQCVSDILALRPAVPPAFGVLRLGTGNALATAIGASGPSASGLAADLRMARQRAAQVELPMLEVEDRLAPFAGVGLDSLILEDYNTTKSLFARTPLAAMASGAPGYALAVAGRSVWRYIAESRPSVVIINEGATAWRVDLSGRRVGRPVRRGEVLYRGPVTIAAASAIPFFGLGLRLFPQASQRTDRFQLRVGLIDTLTLLANLPALFQGTLHDDRIHDFFCTEASIQLDRETPVQIAGDEVGRRSSLRIQTS